VSGWSRAFVEPCTGGRRKQPDGPASCHASRNGFFVSHVVLISQHSCLGPNPFLLKRGVVRGLVKQWELSDSVVEDMIGEFSSSEVMVIFYRNRRDLVMKRLPPISLLPRPLFFSPQSSYVSAHS